jgi:serine phosphatase RsbU (regulator of sigma subunit)
VEHDENTIYVAAADCTGHGVPGAMVSVVCNNALNRSFREHGLLDPGQILDKTREIVIEEFSNDQEQHFGLSKNDTNLQKNDPSKEDILPDVKDGMDIALCSIKGNELIYSGAYNPLWIIRDGELIEFKADKQPIGKFDHSIPYTTYNFTLQKNDAIYMFSDGYADQFGGPNGKKFKAKKFIKLLLSIQDKPMNEQGEILDNEFETWKGDLEQIDDVCVIGVKF